MAWALVSAIKDQLSSFIASEFLSIANFKGEVQKLESKFHTIQAMLNDAEKRQVKEEAVKLWLDKLKDVSYHMDDVLDEWNTAMIKAEIEKQQKDDAEKAETSSAAKKRKVWPLISVPTLLQHRDIAHKIKELNEKLDEIDREGEVYTFALTRGNEEVERPRTTSFVDVSEILGRDKVRDDLVSILLGKGSEEVRNPHVISLVGMGGIGKTTLAQLAYNDDEVKAHFEIKVWVCVSDPFNQGKVAKEIFESIKFQSPNITTLHSETKIFESIESQSPNMTALQTLLEAICKEVEGKKFFLVLDDVWTEGSTMWEPFRLALKYAAQGSRILVTTRKSRVAEMMGSVSIINLEVLSKEDCWLVFSKIAFFDRDPKQREQLEDLGTQIVEKCKGLPLAAKTLGSLMQFKRSREEWKSILDNNFWEFEDVERSLYAPLLLSYYDLSSPLRRCFSFCAVFPKDYVFSSDELVFMWMSQGYIKPKANMEIEIIAREYFENLAIRSFFQDFEKDEDDDQIIRCKMHDIVHDFAQLISKNECFTINSDMDLGVDYKNARHLWLKIPKDIQFLESICSAKNLHTLIFVLEGGYNLFTLSQHFRCLRVLTLYCGYHSMLMGLPDAVGNFIHLRYLYLVNYYGDALPETICNLCNLQILHIKFAGGLLKLPQGMDKLINLRHFKLDCKTYRDPNINFPRGFGRLTSLRTLKYFHINGEDDRCKLGELRNLNHLKGTLQINGLENVVDQCEATNAQLKKKINLRTLKLLFHPNKWDFEEITRGMDALVLNALEPPPNLEDLSIRYYKGPTMSPWMVSLTNLKNLNFEYLFIEHFPPLGKLPVLESLRIERINRLKKLGVEFMGIEESEKKEKDDISITLFPNLIFLEIYELIEWEEWNGIGGEEEEEEDCTRRFAIMPRLQHLSIRSCPKLKSLPNFLRTTPLQHLEIQNCQILEERYKRGTREEWPKISHIPNIMIGYKYVQRDGREYKIDSYLKTNLK
ncbi:putative disease resistance protein RGA3 [Quercus lobata]|uniref:putative disease resistance protein RGA3 n=1 Tax=Quercus lobata TaxID=97700 RepID=UPI0012492736|nr:putative disease resistance protein RGA3 [Quercus lobata]XP_030959651.1 putative disease resistance protein RGA3 [Quercus lobata]XP_030959653.1 putative disease resistance protein RGA3 [Quercus lobata]XP_030959654.1 putative disease resistance protein RGA3 [Quercus lobata]XP_030959655.1 putative disease resistance protein RGA3 [Quercus lobata]XP_030959656.1 putative disease resistance protein RGA3 [Quercus lobata]XP_030959657.1 putative disease resistance protein RGA3 [Quercus lobata]XP_0